MTSGVQLVADSSESNSVASAEMTAMRAGEKERLFVIVYGAGGDLALPGAIEYQGLHSDNVWTELHDPQGGLTMRDVPVPVVHINFPLVDFTTENGPTRTSHAVPKA